MTEIPVWTGLHGKRDKNWHRVERDEPVCQWPASDRLEVWVIHLSELQKLSLLLTMEKWQKPGNWVSGIWGKSEKTKHLHVPLFPGRYSFTKTELLGLSLGSEAGTLEQAPLGRPPAGRGPGCCPHRCIGIRPVPREREQEKSSCQGLHGNPSCEFSRASVWL